MASPNELSKELEEGLSQVSYHVKVLKDFECIEMVKTEPRRGAVEHYYRATSRAFLDGSRLDAPAGLDQARGIGRRSSRASSMTWLGRWKAAPSTRATTFTSAGLPVWSTSRDGTNRQSLVNERSSKLMKIHTGSSKRLLEVR